MARKNKQSRKQDAGGWSSVGNLIKIGLWQNTVISLDMIYLAATWLFSGGDASNMIYFLIAVATNIVGIEFMAYMNRNKRCNDSLQITDAAGHYKDAVAWIALGQLLSIVSSTFLLFWLLTPGKAVWIAWTNLLSPWLSRSWTGRSGYKQRYQKSEKTKSRNKSAFAENTPVHSE